MPNAGEDTKSEETTENDSQKPKKDRIHRGLESNLKTH